MDTIENAKMLFNEYLDFLNGNKEKPTWEFICEQGEAAKGMENLLTEIESFTFSFWIGNRVREWYYQENSGHPKRDGDEQ